VNLLVSGGRLIDPSAGVDALRDVRIRDGRVTEVGEHLPREDEDVFDAAGCCVAPGFIDLHVHLREPGQTYKETIATGSAAAVAGGFTAVACMPNTQPALDSPALIREVRRLAALANLARVYPIAAITVGREGLQPAPFRLLRDAGAVAFSDDGNSVDNPLVLFNAALNAAGLGSVFMSHCEDERLKGGAVANAGSIPLQAGLPVASPLVEEVVVARDMLVCGQTGMPFHLSHLSTALSVELVRFAKARGWPLTCEVTPQHLLLCDADVRSYDGSFIVNPPLRAQADVSALREAVRDGTIDALATDHAPHTAVEKQRLASAAAPGFSGLEIAIGAYHAALPDLSLARFVELLSVNPARIIGVEGGTLRPGSPGDVTIFAGRPWRVDAKRFYSKGKNTPFDGRTFERRAVGTIVGGRIVMRDGVVQTAAAA
jgi:dihydroorotase